MKEQNGEAAAVRTATEDATKADGARMRQRMIEEMQLRRFSDRTIESYVRSVGQLAGWCWKAPHEVTDEELRDYFLLSRPCADAPGVRRPWSGASASIPGRSLSSNRQELPRSFGSEAHPHDLRPLHRPRCLSAESRWPRTPVSSEWKRELIAAGGSLKLIDRGRLNHRCGAIDPIRPRPHRCTLTPPPVQNPYHRACLPRRSADLRREGRVQHRAARRTSATCQPFQCWAMSCFAVLRDDLFNSAAYPVACSSAEDADLATSTRMRRNKRKSTVAPAAIPRWVISFASISLARV